MCFIRAKLGEGALRWLGTVIDGVNFGHAWPQWLRAACQWGWNASMMRGANNQHVCPHIAVASSLLLPCHARAGATAPTPATTPLWHEWWSIDANPNASTCPVGPVDPQHDHLITPGHGGGHRAAQAGPKPRPTLTHPGPPWPMLACGTPTRHVVPLFFNLFSGL